LGPWDAIRIHPLKDTGVDPSRVFAELSAEAPAKVAAMNIERYKCIDDRLFFWW